MFIFFLVYGLIAVVAWHIFYGLEAALNGGGIGRHRFWFPYQCAWQEFCWWYLPGGKQRRIDFIKTKVYQRVSGELLWGTLIGKVQIWTYAEVRHRKNYLKCFDDVMPGKYHLPLYLLAAILWPTSIFWYVVKRRQNQQKPILN